MDKAILKMTKNIGEAAMGYSEATESLEALGLKAVDLEKMSPEKAFGAIADAMNKMGNSYRRADIAQSLFGRGGLQLLVTLQGGSKAVDDMVKKLDELGVAIGDEQAQMVEKANDAWADIGLVWKSLGQFLAINFAPMLELIANKIVAWVKSVGGMGKVAEHIVKAFMFAGALVLDVIKVLKIAWLGYQAAVLTVWGTIIEATGIAVSAIVNTWHKGIASMKTAAGGFLTLWAKGNQALARQMDKTFGEDSVINSLRMGESLWGEGGKAETAGEKLMGKGITQMLKTYKSEFGEFLQSIGQNVQQQGVDHAETILNLVADGWAIGKVPDAFKNMIDNAMGEGFKDLEGQVDIAAPDIKGAAETLQTVLGGFKVEGDQDSRRLDKQIDIEKEQLTELKKISSKIAGTGGGALT